MIHAPTTKFVSAIILMILIIGTTGCGEATGSICSYDSDCPDDEYCIGSQCTPECTRDDDCRIGTYCEVYQREDEPDPIQACLDPSADDGVGCDDDRQCREKLEDDDARCGIHDRCVLTDEGDDQNEANDQNGNDSNGDDTVVGPIIVVEQLDAEGLPISADEDDGDSSDTSFEVRPVRLGAVILRENQDKVVGYGHTLAVASPTEDLPNAELGKPSNLDDDGHCPLTPEEAPYTSLGGPGGRASIELTDGDQEPFSRNDDQELSLQIIAGGPQCPIGPPADDSEKPAGQYRVMICDTEVAESLPDKAECEPLENGPLAGFADMEMTFPD